MGTAEESGFLQDADGTWWHYFSDGRRIRAKDFRCEHCGALFRNWRRNRFCSKTCHDVARFGEPRRTECPQCGRRFIRGEAAQRFCSHRCAATAMHGARPITTPEIITGPLFNSDNPRYSQDENGQWWYTPGGTKDHRRTRAYVASCQRCGGNFLANIFHRKRQDYCSRSCGIRAAVDRDPDGFREKRSANLARGRRGGENSHRWKDGRQITPTGYVRVWAPLHPSRHGKKTPYVFEHRLVIEKTIGRFLRHDEFVHHKNGVRHDNRPENLELWMRGHPPGIRPAEQQHCPTCTCAAAEPA
ncbi:MAG TPA: HNH endonuclease [Dehalococcoidia bacterium]|nr:HNH endonuclease [Dehalococcoidia bacterium]